MMKLDGIRAGDRLVADGGFSCIEEGRICIVEPDDDGRLFVHCQGADLTRARAGRPYDGFHFLEGQEDSRDGHEGEIVGFAPAPREPA